VKGYSRRLEQVEDRISVLEDKIEIKEKNRRNLNKKFKSCERNMQELSNYIKRPNLRIMGIEEEEV
jgi:septal ring factor EnvC (AmiA/AmiB activator)